jgi:hypothetical protein
MPKFYCHFAQTRLGTIVALVRPSYKTSHSKSPKSS